MLQNSFPSGGCVYHPQFLPSGDFQRSSQRFYANAYTQALMETCIYVVKNLDYMGEISPATHGTEFECPS